MSGKFVRASKFRHVMPKAEKKENNFLDVKAASNGDGNFINTNGVYFSVATTGGGGPVFVHKLSATGKFLPNEPTLNVHKAAVVDTDWSPFNTSLIATASDDCTAKITVIPEGGLGKGIDVASATLSGHDKKLHLCKFHPTASNVLSTSSYDLSIRAWDIEKQAQIAAFTDHPDLIQSYEWNANGSQVASSCKDRFVVAQV
jgi:coronin-1B/1C/6